MPLDSQSITNTSYPLRRAFILRQSYLIKSDGSNLCEAEYRGRVPLTRHTCAACGALFAKESIFPFPVFVFRMICGGRAGRRRGWPAEYNVRARACVAPFDSRGGKAKPFTYSRNAPPAYEWGRARLPPTRSSPLLSPIPVSSRPFVVANVQPPAPLALFHPAPPPSHPPPAALRVYARPPRDTHGYPPGSPSAVYPQSIKTACQHEYQKPGRRGVQRAPSARPLVGTGGTWRGEGRAGDVREIYRGSCTIGARACLIDSVNIACDRASAPSPPSPLSRWRRWRASPAVYDSVSGSALYVFMRPRGGNSAFRERE